MLYRKVSDFIGNFLKSDAQKILVIDGARQIGKSYIIRHVGQKLFKNYIEINLMEDSQSAHRLENIGSIEDLYFQISMIYGEKLGTKEDTLIFLDEIQVYPNLLTLLKFLRQDNRFTFICSGSLLGVTLSQTSSIPMGSMELVHMYPLDFEEFLYAKGFNFDAVKNLEQKFQNHESLDENTHKNMMDLFKKYLIVGGLPDAVNAFVESQNVAKIRKVQNDTHDYYAADASKYDTENKLKIRRIFDLIPSNLENKKKRVVLKDIENKKGVTAARYENEFDYLVSSGIALEVRAVSNPKFPLSESQSKNLLKLYLNDAGILSSILYGMNPNAILNDEKSINLGTLYECVVASELKAHGFRLFYYDNKDKGEVDFLIDDYDNLKVLPVEVKSGKDYFIHRALNTFLSNEEYNLDRGIVLSNKRKIYTDEKNIL